MLFFPRATTRTCLIALPVLAVLLVAGCATDRPSRREGNRRPAVPTLAGSETFFAGRILAEVKIGALGGFERRGNGSNIDAEGGPRRRGGPGGMGGGPERPRQRPDAEPGTPPPRVRMGAGAGSPPVAIHLQFTNTGDAPAELQVVDFLSPLGNFVVHPARLTLAPGQSLEVEPMASRLAGEATGGEITLSLFLDGTRETKTVAVALVADDRSGPEN